MYMRIQCEPPLVVCVGNVILLRGAGDPHTRDISYDISAE